MTMKQNEYDYENKFIQIIIQIKLFQMSKIHRFMAKYKT